MNSINNIIDLIKNKITEEWILAGHPWTGKFEDSLEGVVNNEDNKIIISILGNDYGLYLSEGVPANRIPFRRSKRGQGKGGTSKYITGLKNWVQGKLGIADERVALSIAFAIATKHSHEGMPVRNGELGSKFLDEVNKKNEKLIESEIIKLLDMEINK